MKPATRLIVLFMAVLLAPHPVAAACGALTAPRISVAVDAAPVHEDRSLSLTELSRIPSASRRAGMEAYDRTLGLTEADIGARADIDLVTVEDGNGGYCTRARSALIVLEWKTVMHIAAQIPPGSCVDRVVRGHERKHVSIDRKLIPIARQAIEIALTSVIRHSIPGRTIADSQRNLQDQARAAVNQAIDIFAVVRSRKQLALDSQAEYDKVPNSCGIVEYLKVMQGSQPKAGS